jgi:hypothetical protein
MHTAAPLTLVILAAGRASRYGRLKQLEPVGPNGEALLDYGIVDALRGGFGRIVLVVPPAMEERFLSHIGQQLGSTLDVGCVAQRLDDVPPGFNMAPDRTKPWGTAHAVLAARSLLAGPFAVANADDIYGRDAFEALARHLHGRPAEAALIAYRLDRTLSEHGGVSRGICQVDSDGYLREIREAVDVRREGLALVGRRTDGSPLTLRGDEPASMNLWGFPATTPSALDRLWRGFLDMHGTNVSAEFLLSTAVQRLVAAGSSPLRVLATDAEWFGMTFVEDTTGVKQRIAQHIAEGQYPYDLHEVWS